MRAWIKECKIECDIHGRQHMELTLLVPDATVEDMAAVRDAMEVPLLAAGPGYQPEVTIESDGQATVELIKR